VMESGSEIPSAIELQEPKVKPAIPRKVELSPSAESIKSAESLKTPEIKAGEIRKPEPDEKTKPTVPKPNTLPHTQQSPALVATYDEGYAKIAASRYNYGPLTGHGEALIKKAINNIPENANILEIGCSTGLFLQQLEDSLKGKNVKIRGADVNEAAIKEASLKHDAFYTDAQNISQIESNSQDAVFSLHTYEHIPDLGKAFQELERILKPGGKAYIIVPPNLYGLETIRVAIEELGYKSKGLFGAIKTFVESWKYARKLHCSNLGTPLGGARKHAERILKKNNIGMKVSGGMKINLALANLLVFEKPKP
jgi:SAM-dependent methyltransferase